MTALPSLRPMSEGHAFTPYLSDAELVATRLVPTILGPLTPAGGVDLALPFPCPIRYKDPDSGRLVPHQARVLQDEATGLWVWEDDAPFTSIAVKRTKESGPPAYRHRTAIASAYLSASQPVSRHAMLPAVQLVPWTARLILDARCPGVTPATVEAVPLPPDAPDAARKTYAGFQRLVQCRLTFPSPELPEGHALVAPFAFGFGTAWCGMTEARFGAGMRYLRERGFLWCVDVLSSRTVQTKDGPKELSLGANAIPLYCLGDGRTVRDIPAELRKTRQSKP